MQLNLETCRIIGLTVQQPSVQASALCMWKCLPGKAIARSHCCLTFVVWAAAGFQGPTGPTGCLRRNASLSVIVFPGIPVHKQFLEQRHERDSAFQ